MSKISEKASALLEEIRALLELSGENPFKVRAYEKAQAPVRECSDLERRAREGTLTELAGVGKGISEILTEFLLKGTCAARDELRAKLPAGLSDLIQIPGLGPKKARQVIEELGISTVAELEYACRENRLVNLKGFGEKIQKKVLEGIQFVKSTQDRARIVDVLEAERTILKQLRKNVVHGSVVIEPTGPLRRRLEVLDQLDFLVGLQDKGADAKRKKIEQSLAEFRNEHPGVIASRIEFVPMPRFGYEWVRTTSSSEHWKALGSPSPFDARTEHDFFTKLGIDFIPPEMRETAESVALAKAGKISEVLAVEGVQGVFHNHTTRSDGTASLEQMVREARDLGYHYIGISDHSQSAFYAQGLKSDALKDQEKEIRQVQEKYPDIRVFWGIESDILADGELDYPAAQLKKFDFVIASVHSRFKMDRAQMTERIVQAIRNPATRMVGHLTGRLLLGRPGYELDMDQVIREAARHSVAIEINANPARLDIDWRWGPALREHGTQVAINPDAHSLEGLRDTSFGVTVARKALLPAGLVVNARGTKEVEAWLRRQ